MKNTNTFYNKITPDNFVNKISVRLADNFFYGDINNVTLDLINKVIYELTPNDLHIYMSLSHFHRTCRVNRVHCSAYIDNPMKLLIQILILLIIWTIFILKIYEFSIFLIRGILNYLS
jgi:hypothetical protein